LKNGKIYFLLMHKMKKKIVILGSTGSIGISTLEVIKKNMNNFDIILLTANKSYKRLAQQAKKFNAKNVLIKDKRFHFKLIKLLKNKKINVYSGDTSISKIVRKKVDFTISSIVGLAGLQPTIDSIKVSKNLAIANKETIICAWDILVKLIKKYNTKILPVDSEHFSIMELTKNTKDEDVEEIIITASGGPFLNKSIKKLNSVKPNQAINHPNWNMGKKISVDSANLMNKVFEVIEANKIFNFNKKKYKVLIHPQSYVHSIIRFKNGLIKMILYNTDMKIPISNILLGKKNNNRSVKKLNAKLLSKISFQEVDANQFPSIKLVETCFNMGPSTTTIVNSSNEVLVDYFLKGKIRFLDIVKTINKILKDSDFPKYAKRKPITVNEIKIIDKWARLKTKDMCVK